MGFSSPVEVITLNFMRDSTRSFRLMYSSRSTSGQKFTSWMASFGLPMRSTRPNRWMIRTGFQWMS